MVCFICRRSLLVFWIKKLNWFSYNCSTVFFVFFIPILSYEIIWTIMWNKNCYGNNNHNNCNFVYFFLMGEFLRHLFLSPSHPLSFPLSSTLLGLSLSHSLTFSQRFPKISYIRHIHHSSTLIKLTSIRRQSAPDWLRNNSKTFFYFLFFCKISLSS